MREVTSAILQKVESVENIYVLLHIQLRTAEASVSGGQRNFTAPFLGEGRTQAILSGRPRRERGDTRVLYGGERERERLWNRFRRESLFP